MKDKYHWFHGAAAFFAVPVPIYRSNWPVSFLANSPVKTRPFHLWLYLLVLSSLNYPKTMSFDIQICPSNTLPTILSNWTIVIGL